ncbi:MAG: hypothetical protein H6657_08950 [Ardenticatenaceae bacterium]|nr:hypothetical protein [Ardenticatenaceae bacterium]
MGSSFTQFRDHGFWSRDHFLEGWLDVLAAECMKHMPALPWLEAACKHWELQATGIFNGCVHAKLDEFLTDEERVSFIISISERVKDRFPQDHPLNQTGDLFVRLLKGELTTDASSPLDYIISYPRT